MTKHNLPTAPALLSSLIGREALLTMVNTAYEAVRTWESAAEVFGTTRQHIVHEDYLQLVELHKGVCALRSMLDGAGDTAAEPEVGPAPSEPEVGYLWVHAEPGTSVRWTEWIDWSGGKYPTEGRVQVKTRGGDVSATADANNVPWGTPRGKDYDIVAYRFVKDLKHDR